MLCCRLTGPITGGLPLNYTAWSSLKAFELGGTRLTGSIPAVYTAAWPALENFTVDGALLSGYVPDAFSWTNITWYTVQNTSVFSDSVQPFWVLKAQAATLRKVKGLRLGKRGDDA